MPEIIVAEDLQELSRIAADRFVRLAATSISSSGRFTVALAGGSTPKSLYRLLSSDEYKTKIDWAHVFFFFGDERFVPADDPESNYRMARENLLDPIDIPSANIFRWHTETGSPDEVAANYEEMLREFFNLGESVPCFDLILLGLGADGHTASLFPNSPALGETKRLAISNRVEKFGAYRLTFTFPLINNAANIIFLVSGPEKAFALTEILKETGNFQKYPARAVRPVGGELIWLVDEQASTVY
jgi:6-phosphogluconolactonase